MEVPEGPTLRDRLLPKTVVGLATIILAVSIGAAFSGAVLFSYYDYKLQRTTDKVNGFINGYKKQFDNARGDLAAQTATDKSEIAKALGPLNQLQATSDTLQGLAKKVRPSMFFVHTLDQNGQPSVGAGFVVASDQNQTLVLTSYTTVQAATKRPGPDLFVRQGDQDTRVTVYTWDERYDLALIILSKGNVPALQPASSDQTPNVGDRVFAVSGLGSLGASLTQGFVTDVSDSGVQHTAPVGQAFQGGPLVTSDGKVLAISSRSYAPLNFTSDGVWFAPYVRAACQRVLQCPGGQLNGASGQRG